METRHFLVHSGQLHEFVKAHDFDDALRQALQQAEPADKSELAGMFEVTEVLGEPHYRSVNTADAAAGNHGQKVNHYEAS